MSKVVRVGFIGAGGIAQGHLRNLKNMEDVRIVGIYDIVKERTAEVAANFGALPFDDPYELLDTKQIDAIFVCTPPFARSDYETTAAKKGVHLFAEKPPGLSLSEVEAKLDIIQSSGIIHSSGLAGRYAAANDKAKELLAGRQVDLLHVFRYNGWPNIPWYSSMAKSGGQMVDQTIHQIDAVRYLLGDFKDVYARFEQRSLKQLYKDADIYDVGAVTFTLEAGIVGTVTNTNVLPGYSRNEMMMIGNNFTIIIDRNTNKVVFAEGSDVHTFDFKGDKNQETQDRAFIEAVRTGKQELIRCSYEEAYKTLKVVLAMNESTKLGLPVQIR